VKQPALMWYPGDHRRDSGVQACSLEARGVWFEMINLMHDGEPYGHLTAGGHPISLEVLGRMLGLGTPRARKILKELEDHKVFSRTSKGVIFSRRMVRDEAFRQLRKESGKLGGNRKLGAEYNVPGFVYLMGRRSDNAVKIGISKSPAKRLYRIRCQFPGDEITLLTQEYVPDMGKAEGQLHAANAQWRDGEWFHLPDDRRAHLCSHLGYHLKVNGEGEERVNGQHSPPPAIAVAVASAFTPSPTVERFFKALPIDHTRQHWSALISGWMQGTGLPGKGVATQEDVDNGLSEYLAGPKRDFSAAHVRTFVARARDDRLRAKAKTNGHHPVLRIDRAWLIMKTRRVPFFEDEAALNAEIADVVEGRELTAEEGVELSRIVHSVPLKPLRNIHSDTEAITYIERCLTQKGAHVNAAV
jgi:hypothetical protein